MVATRIGVTGHRLLAPHPDLATAVDDALAAIELRRPAPWVLVSGFAEGADELVAQRALVRGVGARGAAAAARRRLRRRTSSGPPTSGACSSTPPPSRRSTPAVPRPECYRAQGLALVERCDELIALWNGGEARGPGGTGEIVEAARDGRLTVTWIEAADARDGTTREPVTHVEGLG